jgi:hypothetical protein
MHPPVQDYDAATELVQSVRTILRILRSYGAVALRNKNHIRHLRAYKVMRRHSLNFLIDVFIPDRI